MTASSRTSSGITSRKRNRALPRDLLNAFQATVESVLQQSIESLSDRSLVQESVLQETLRLSITACLTVCAYLIWRHRCGASKDCTVRQFFQEVRGAASFANVDIDWICDRLINSGI